MIILVGNAWLEKLENLYFHLVLERKEIDSGKGKYGAESKVLNTVIRGIMVDGVIGLGLL